MPNEQERYVVKDLNLDELSLVDRPANSDSTVAIVKRKGSAMAEHSGKMPKDEMDKMTDAEKRRMKEIMDKEGMSEKEAGYKAMSEMRKSADEGMTPEDLAKRLATLETQVSSLEKQASEHGLSVEKSDDGTVKLSKAAQEEYVTIGGERVAKSAVPGPVLKQLEAQNEQIAKMQERQEQEDLRKRADAEIKNLKGTADQRGALLKAVDSIKDAEVRKAVHETLKAADAATAQMFSEVGKSAAEDEASATYRLNKMAQDHATQNGTDFYTAYAEVTKTVQGAKLMRESEAE